jgi:branched-chain amino acid transport system ATP-binding protein
MSLLTVEDLHASYGRARVLHGLDLRVEPGEAVTILGANGAGKTTTLRAISGMVATRGSVRFDGRRIDGWSPERIVRAGIAHVPEGRGTFASLSVAENLRLGAFTRRGGAQVSQDFDTVCDLFPALRDRLDQQAGSLSGGEQQMLAVARALMLRPALLLLDEPSLGLAPALTRQVFAIVERINRERGTAVVVVEQNAELALRLAARAYVLESGRIALAGTTDELAANAPIRRVYLGY